jgi:Ca2+-binding RTX toxin-like protein
MAHVSLTIRDYSDELSTVTVPIDDIDELNDDIGEVDDELVALASAIDAVTLGNIARQSVTVHETEPANSRPANAFAQRETGLRLYYQTTGAQGYRGTITIPAPDLAALTFVEGSDAIVLADGAVVEALVTALETHMEVRGEAVTIVRAAVVGRNS